MVKIRPRYNLELSGRRMRNIRIERNFSVEDVRMYMGFTSVQAIYRWEYGKCLPAADNLLALAELYEVNPQELLVKEVREYIFYSIFPSINAIQRHIRAYCGVSE